jgi:hypothetical protein
VVGALARLGWTYIASGDQLYLHSPHLEVSTGTHKNGYLYGKNGYLYGVVNLGKGKTKELVVPPISLRGHAWRGRKKVETRI